MNFMRGIDPARYPHLGVVDEFVVPDGKIFRGLRAEPCGAEESRDEGQSRAQRAVERLTHVLAAHWEVQNPRNCQPAVPLRKLKSRPLSTHFKPFRDRCVNGSSCRNRPSEPSGVACHLRALLKSTESLKARPGSRFALAYNN